MFQIKRLEKIKDIETVETIEQQIWKKPPTPFHQTYTASKNGGLVLGAYKNEKLVGFQYSFSGFKNGESYLCSHMLGILPDYQKNGLGYEMKLVQQKLALEMGYSLIVWTFDPLESVNAYLNLHKLKGIGATYLENHYGTMKDSLNQGLPTDRFLVEWWIRSEHVTKGNKGYEEQPFTPMLETELTKEGFPTIIGENNRKADQRVVYVPVPENIQQMKKEQPELAKEWRFKTREIFRALCQEGYIAEDVKRDTNKRISYYMFKKRHHLPLNNVEEETT
ncbi:GNAT family N-acetyltransferase [Bacillus sp. DJP31]|uniref:GNAT family N-acetyltransferase n=1 Tax=Bacillus sp. DJP31 TaxID=3409789 RepID=UPI003BB75FD1